MHLCITVVYRLCSSRSSYCVLYKSEVYTELFICWFIPASYNNILATIIC